MKHSTHSYPPPFGFTKQHGAALIISLIILGAITLLGISNMQTASLELKMASTAKSRNVSFSAAEAALVAVERSLEEGLLRPTRSQLYEDCSVESCYNPSCEGGLCFNGLYSFESATSEAECSVSDESYTEFFSDPDLDVWNTESRHQTVPVDGLTSEVKFIIEFLCFVDSGNGTFDRLLALGDEDRPPDDPNAEPLFGITVLAEDNNGRAPVLLRSTYRITDLQD